MVLCVPKLIMPTSDRSHAHSFSLYSNSLVSIFCYSLIIMSSVTCSFNLMYITYTSLFFKPLWRHHTGCFWLLHVSLPPRCFPFHKAGRMCRVTPTSQPATGSKCQSTVSCPHLPVFNPPIPVIQYICSDIYTERGCMIALGLSIIFAVPEHPPLNGTACYSVQRDHMTGDSTAMQWT